MRTQKFGLILAGSFLISGCSLSGSNMPVMHSFADAPSSSLFTFLDWRLSERTAQNSLQYSATETSSWSNPETGITGTFTPLKKFQSAEGQICRNFHMVIEVSNQNDESRLAQTNKVSGTSCKNRDDVWAHLMEPLPQTELVHSNIIN